MRANGASFGPVLIGTGLTAILLSQGIDYTALGDSQDPGPRMFPVALGIFLVLGGAYEWIRWFLDRRRAPAGSASPSWAAGARSMATDPQNRDVLILVAALCVYIPAISWLGFSASTLLFAVAIMRRLGARWLLTGVMSVVLVVGINLLFVSLFKVQLGRRDSF